MPERWLVDYRRVGVALNVDDLGIDALGERVLAAMRCGGSLD